jgi:hypothetical protein
MVPGPPLDDEAAASMRRLLDKGSLGAAGLAVDDCRKTYEELVAKGVTFVQEPSERPYGGRGGPAGQQRQLAGAGRAPPVHARGLRSRGRGGGRGLAVRPATMGG